MKMFIAGIAICCIVGIAVAKHDNEKRLQDIGRQRAEFILDYEPRFKSIRTKVETESRRLAHPYHGLIKDNYRPTEWTPIVSDAKVIEDATYRSRLSPSEARVVMDRKTPRPIIFEMLEQLKVMEDILRTAGSKNQWQINEDRTRFSKAEAALDRIISQAIFYKNVLPPELQE
jgi:hypothetical protein